MERTFQDFYTLCERIVIAFGRDRIVDDIVADGFGKLRNDRSKTHGPVALGNEIQRVRMVFKYAYDQGLIDKPMRYGPGFKKPSRKTLRKHRHQAQAKHGKRMFEASELPTIIATAGQPLKAMTLLGEVDPNLCTTRTSF